MFDAGLRCDRAFRFVVASRVVFRLADLYVLDHAVLDYKHVTLATDAAERLLRTFMRHDHADFSGIPATGVGKKRDDGALDFLIFCPCFHHGTIVHAIDKHLINALGLQLILLAQVARDLH